VELSNISPGFDSGDAFFHFPFVIFQLLFVIGSKTARWQMTTQKWQMENGERDCNFNLKTRLVVQPDL
jgi:hypothetical protein